MDMNKCVFVCALYIYIRIYIYTYTCIYVQVHMYRYICTGTYIFVYICTYNVMRSKAMFQNGLPRPGKAFYSSFRWLVLVYGWANSPSTAGETSLQSLHHFLLDLETLDWNVGNAQNLAIEFVPGSARTPPSGSELSA